MATRSPSGARAPDVRSSPKLRFDTAPRLGSRMRSAATASDFSADTVMRGVLTREFGGGADLTYCDGLFRRFTGTHWAGLSEAELGRLILAELPPVSVSRRQRTPSAVAFRPPASRATFRVQPKGRSNMATLKLPPELTRLMEARSRAGSGEGIPPLGRACQQPACRDAGPDEAHAEAKPAVGPAAPGHARSKRHDHALSWLKAGVPIVPLAERGKNPINSTGSLDPLTTPEEVDQLFEERPDANYGLVTGRRSNLIALDVDGPEGESSLAALEEQNTFLPRTLTVQTSKGRHLLFDHDGPAIRNRVGFVPGLDIRGEGGYVVGVGSLHPSGAVYRYEDGLDQRSTPIAELPDWLVRELSTGEEGSKPSSDKQGTAESDAPSSDTRVVVEGSRNRHLTSLAGRLRNSELSEEALAAALIAENQHVCTPPLDEAEVRKIATSVSRYQPKTVGGDEAEKVADAVLHQRFGGGSELIFAIDGQFSFEPIGQLHTSGTASRSTMIQTRPAPLTTPPLRRSFPVLKSPSPL